MSKSYEATLDHGRIEWREEQPDVVKARIIVTVLDDPAPVRPRRQAPTSIAGKGRTLGDIVQPLVDEAGWECLK